VNRLTTSKNASNAKRDPYQLGSQQGNAMDLMFMAMAPDISLFVLVINPHVRVCTGIAFNLLQGS
jgi:hypothetical protein